MASNIDECEAQVAVMMMMKVKFHELSAAFLQRFETS
jgi:hypothetical protein